MCRLSFWLTGSKKFADCFKSVFRKHLNSKDDFCFLSSSSVINYSSYLSGFFKKSMSENFSPSHSPQVSSPDGTFSFNGDSAEEGRKIVWLWEINKIPVRYRKGLVQLGNRYSKHVLTGGLFVPRDFSFDLATKNDFFILRKEGWPAIWKEVEARLESLRSRGEKIPDFSSPFTTKEKIILRLLFRSRDRFVRLEEICAYLYGRRMIKNLRASSFLIYALRKKIDRLTQTKNVMESFRKFGYRLNFDFLREKKIID